MQAKHKTTIGIVISAIFLGLILYNVDFSEILRTFKLFNMENLHVIVGIYLLSLLTRTLRWKYLLLADKRFSLYDLASSWTLGTFLNSFMPARAGDIWRAFDIGAKTKNSKMKIFGSVMLERILDGISICAILFIAIKLFSNLVWIRELANLAVIIFGGSLVILYLIVKFNKIDNICSFLQVISGRLPFGRVLAGKIVNKICLHLTSFICGFEVLKNNYYTIQAIVLSIATWGLETLLTYIVISSFGFPIPISASLFVISFIALSTMIPSSSIYVGPYQYAYILALGIYFVPKSTALAIALVHQVIIMGVIAALSAIFIIMNFYKKNKKER